MFDYENLVSIVIPSRTFDFLLEKCVYEIRCLYPNVEIILVLDKIDIPLSINLYKVTILKSTSLYISAKRNQGVHQIKTKYVAFIDSDAYPKRYWLENAIDYLERNPKYSVVEGSWLSFPQESFLTRCLRIVRFAPLFINKELRVLIEKNSIDKDITLFASASLIFRVKDYLSSGEMNEKIYINEDCEFAYRLNKKGYKMRFVKNSSVYHRESTFYCFFAKVFCNGFYKTNMFFQEIFNQQCEKYFSLTGFKYFIPLITIFIYSILIFVLKFNLLVLIGFPLFGLLILFIQSLFLTSLLSSNKVKGFFVILLLSIVFCVTFIISTFLWTFNIKLKDLQLIYKHY